MFDRSKLWAIGLLFAAFATGVGVGGAATAVFGERGRDGDRESRRGRPRQEVSYLDRLDRDLELTPKQRDSVAAILKRYDEPMRELWRRERHQVDSMRLQVRSQIAGLLDERQREQFQLMNQRVDSLRTVRERGGASRGR
ncbi:MAG: hypothetical protein HYW52_10015 [Gemmatimonadetes bacterium]|nr:hypothetical protein [Gemmatimonadota bacterium]MBI2615990.1 hypothetical protein [Gemmatimonadota bacterium]MBI3081840.1 hypothetical protein [Gemmatimonadota bacterium]